jgi:4-hydroxythreonine-4-phosphate dehydrogenase
VKNWARIVVTPGEPAGIGPDITVRIAQRAWPAELICVCDPDLLYSRAKKIGLPLTLELFDPKQSVECPKPSSLKYIPVSLKAISIPGKLNRENAPYVLECLKIAADHCLNQTMQALVTGPVQKSILNDAGIAFTGHTEFLANYCHVKNSVMLFVADSLRVALATTHLPLSKVPEAITAEHLQTILRILHAELKNKFHLSDPKIIICGLNPHAGEGGHLGYEEIKIIDPVLKELRKENMNLIGPLPADTVFTEKTLRTADAVLAMYHDQALPIVKYLSFGHAVNVTLGLPIIRTSVDHGTALDVAGTQNADPSSLAAAIKLAITLTS